MSSLPLSTLGECREQLLRLDHGRVQLTDHYPRGPIGDGDRVVQRHAGTEHHTKRRNHRVAGAADVEYFARPRLFVPHTTRFIEPHSVLPESYQQRLQLKLLSQRLRLAHKLFFGFPASRDFAELCAIGRHDGRSDVPGIVVAFRVDQHGLAFGARRFDHLRDMCESALTVVGKYDYVAVSDHTAVVVELVEQHFAARRHFEVYAQHLLLPSNYAELDSGGDRAVPVQARLDPGLLQKLRELAARLVVANYREQGDIRPERSGVGGNIGRPAGSFLCEIRLDFDNLHGRLVRNAPHLAEPVAVEHDVAHHENLRLAQLRENQLFRFHFSAFAAARPIG